MIPFDNINMGSEDDLNTALHLQHHQPHNFDFDFDYPNNNDDDLLEPTSLSDPNLDPYEGMEFDSEQSARIFYNSYARRVGFSTRVSVYQRSRRDGSIICRQIVCSREGFRREGNGNRSKR